MCYVHAGLCPGWSVVAAYPLRGSHAHWHVSIICSSTGHTSFMLVLCLPTTSLSPHSVASGPNNLLQHSWWSATCIMWCHCSCFHHWVLVCSYHMTETNIYSVLRHAQLSSVCHLDTNQEAFVMIMVCGSRWRRKKGGSSRGTALKTPSSASSHVAWPWLRQWPCQVQHYWWSFFLNSKAETDCGGLETFHIYKKHSQIMTWSWKQHSRDVIPVVV